jgi:LEA14-like dessication related protein
MNAKRIVLILLAIFFLSIAAFFVVDLYHYAKDKSPYRTLFAPRLEIGVLEVTYLSIDTTKMHVKMLIYSPLPFNMAVDSLQYKISINDLEVLKSTYATSFDIRKWDSTLIDMPATIYNNNISTIEDKADKKGSDSLVYRIQTTFSAKIPFKKKFDIDASKLLPRLYIPSVRLEKINYDSLNLKGVTLYLKMIVGNRNKFSIHFKEMKYKFTIADNPWVHGTESGKIDIQQQDSTELTLPLRISFANIYKSIGPLIRKGEKVDYKFEMDLKMVSESNILKDSKMGIKSTGTEKEIIKLAKDERKIKKEKNKDEKERKKESVK